MSTTKDFYVNTKKNMRIDEAYQGIPIEGLVAKIGGFLTQNGDEIRPRRQKMVFLNSKW
jgi:hypothetical protein